MDIASIQKRISLIEKYTLEVREAKEMLKDELENEPLYLESVAEVKAATQKRKLIKDEILARGPNQKLMEGIKNNNEELATLRDILSVELSQYFRENNAEEIPSENGENLKFKVVARLLPKNAKSSDRDNFGKYTKDA